MIEVVTIVAGQPRDRAEADTPEGALAAARVLRAEAASAGCASNRIEVVFVVDGRQVGAL